MNSLLDKIHNTRQKKVMSSTWMIACRPPPVVVGVVASEDWCIAGTSIIVNDDDDGRTSSLLSVIFIVILDFSSLLLCVSNDSLWDFDVNDGGLVTTLFDWGSSDMENMWCCNLAWRSLSCALLLDSNSTSSLCISRASRCN